MTASSNIDRSSRTDGGWRRGRGDGMARGGVEVMSFVGANAVLGDPPSWGPMNTSDPSVQTSAASPPGGEAAPGRSSWFAQLWQKARNVVALARR